MVQSQNPKWVSIRDAAEARAVSQKTIRRWITSGLVKAERVGPRLIRVDLESLETLGKPLQYMGGDAA